MNAVAIYRARSRWLIWVAFVCAVTIHLAVIAIAENKSKPVSLTSISEPGPPIIGTIEPLQPDEPDLVVPSDPSVIEKQEFVDENVTPRPIRSRKKVPTTAIVRSIGISSARATQSGSVKALALFAPRPSYPYEARRSGTTGSGVAELAVNATSGNVIDARMSQSTGSAILDNATLETLGRWRFKPGVASNIAVPITYTLTGVSY